MKARKSFIVIAYDITDDRRRYRVVKALKQYGTAINMSVYECMLTDSQFEKLLIRLGKLIDVESDKIVYYDMSGLLHQDYISTRKDQKGYEYNYGHLR